MQIGKAARSNGSHIKSRLKMEPHGVFKEVTKQCTNKDHYQSVLTTTGSELKGRGGSSNSMPLVRACLLTSQELGEPQVRLRSSRSTVTAVHEV